MSIELYQEFGDNLSEHNVVVLYKDKYLKENIEQDSKTAAILKITHMLDRIQEEGNTDRASLVE